MSGGNRAEPLLATMRPFGFSQHGPEPSTTIREK